MWRMQQQWPPSLHLHGNMETSWPDGLVLKTIILPNVNGGNEPTADTNAHICWLTVDKQEMCSCVPSVTKCSACCTSSCSLSVRFWAVGVQSVCLSWDRFQGTRAFTQWVTKVNSGVCVCGTGLSFSYVFSQDFNFLYSTDFSWTRDELRSVRTEPGACWRCCCV